MVNFFSFFHQKNPIWATWKRCSKKRQQEKVLTIASSARMQIFRKIPRTVFEIVCKSARFGYGCYLVPPVDLGIGALPIPR